MFWRMQGLSTASPVETILDKDDFTLEELLDEDEIIQECKSLNSRLINFLRERSQVEQLIRYIVEEAPEDAEKKRTFKFPFISCEIITCEVDVILRTLVEDEELLDLLFSFLGPSHSHSTLLAGYFGKVVICLLLRKTVPIMNYIQAHQEIIKQMVDLIGITSIMEVLVRLIGADEHIHANYAEAIRWLEDTDVLEMIVDKFVSSDSPEWHANAAEALCAISRYAPPGLAAKVSSPSFVGRLLNSALEESRPKSVLVYSLSVCISLLDPKRLTLGSYHMYSHQYAQGSTKTANPETVHAMLENLDQVLKLLIVSSDESVLLTTYGKLQPPLGKHRLKIVEFIAVLLSIGNEAAEKELIRLGAVQRVLDLFFEYPYNNFLHHHAESIISSGLESKSPVLVEHILRECNLVQKIIEAEKNFTLSHDPPKPTIPADGKQPPRIGNIGHVTRISNKLVQLANSSSEVHAILQENNDWVNWYSPILSKRNSVENVYQWTCGRPSTIQDRTNSDDEDYQDRDYDVAALANNLSQALQYGIYNNNMEESNGLRGDSLNGMNSSAIIPLGHGSLDQEDEDVYFDDESAEVVISSLRLGDDQESSLFTNSNWFAFEDKKTTDDDRTTDAPEAPEPSSVAEPNPAEGETNKVEATTDTATSSPPPEPKPEPTGDPSGSTDADTKPPEWVQWRETSSSGSSQVSEPNPPSLPNGATEPSPGPAATEPSEPSEPPPGPVEQQKADEVNQGASSGAQV